MSKVCVKKSLQLTDVANKIVHNPTNRLTIFLPRINNDSPMSHVCFELVSMIYLSIVSQTARYFAIHFRCVDYHVVSLWHSQKELGCKLVPQEGVAASRRGSRCTNLPQLGKYPCNDAPCICCSRLSYLISRYVTRDVITIVRAFVQRS